MTKPQLIDKIFGEGIKNAQAMVVVLSRFSIQKPWVREELNAGMVKRIEGKYKIIPVVIDDCGIPEALASTVWQRIADLESYESEFERIVASIYGYTQKPTLGPPQEYVKSEKAIGILTSLPACDEICDDLINVLSTREDLNMRDPKRRSFLLRNFSSQELDLLGKDRHPDDMLVDLSNIVYYVAKRLERLDLLIKEALALAQNETTKKELEAILIKLKSRQVLNKL